MDRWYLAHGTSWIEGSRGRPTKSPEKSEVHQRPCNHCGQFVFIYRLRGEDFDRISDPVRGLVPGEAWDQHDSFPSENLIKAGSKNESGSSPKTNCGSNSTRLVIFPRLVADGSM